MDKERAWRGMAKDSLVAESVFSGTNILARTVDEERWK